MSCTIALLFMVIATLTNHHHRFLLKVLEPLHLLIYFSLNNCASVHY
jgi:hypothetical protein